MGLVRHLIPTAWSALSHLKHNRILEAYCYCMGCLFLGQDGLKGEAIPWLQHCISNLTLSLSSNDKLLLNYMAVNAHGHRSGDQILEIVEIFA